MDKRSLTERDICTKFVLPAAKRAGWDDTPQAWRVTAEDVKAHGYNLDIKNPHTVADNHGDPQMLLADLNSAETETATLRDQLKAILAEALAR
jgi:type I restriction enzyme M protein